MYMKLFAVYATVCKLASRPMWGVQDSTLFDKVVPQLDNGTLALITKIKLDHRQILQPTISY